MAKHPASRAATDGPKVVRCAIYTRKSTEEGLDQAFNSLDAQREACAAYVASQRHEGWTLLPDHYDDGGFSGGNMARPGLQQLLADVAAKKVDVIVVYKVDRLTRALADFAKIVDVLDGAGASFVSVTQSFNTTTSMGRLTLNVLLSFAQFEREVTGERIRDKVAASKRKGMWMGGMVPLGYDVHERKLIINEAEAATVRRMFERYLALGSIGDLAGELDRDGIRSKARTLANGTACGNRMFSKGAAAHILNSRLYIGEIAHKDDSFPGEHSAIIDRVIWDAVQAKLDANRWQHRVGSRADQPSLLAGIIEDSEGRAMTPRHTTKGNRRYRYYITAPDTADGKMPNDGSRVPAGEVEQLVRMRLAAWLGDQPTLVGLYAPLVEQTKLQSLVQACADHSDAVVTMATTELRELLLALDLRVGIGEQNIAVSFAPMMLAQRLGNIDPVNDGERHTIIIAAALTRRGQELRLAYSASDKAAPADPNVKLIGLIAKAETAHRTLIAGDPLDKNQRNHLVRMARLKFLAPDIVTAILDGHQPVHLSARKLLREAAIPLCWKQQRELLGF